MEYWNEWGKESELLEEFLKKPESEKLKDIFNNTDYENFIKILNEKGYFTV